MAVSTRDSIKGPYRVWRSVGSDKDSYDRPSIFQTRKRAAPQGLGGCTELVALNGIYSKDALITEGCTAL